MGSGQSVPKDSPLACVLKNLKPLLSTKLKANRLKQLCIQIWPQYQIDNQDHWPEFSTFDFNILQNLTNFHKWNDKWSEVPYAQAFRALRSRPSLCKACSTHEVLLCTLPHKQKSSSSTNGWSWTSAPSEFNPMNESPSYTPPCQPSPSPSSNSPPESKTSPDSPSAPLPHLHDSPSAFLPPLPHSHVPSTCFPWERWQDQRASPESTCHFHCQIWAR